MNDTVALELQIPKDTYLAIKQAAEKHKKTEAEWVVEAIQVYLEQLARIDPLLGLFSDEPELIDEITEEAMNGRGNTPLRLIEVVGE